MKANACICIYSCRLFSMTPFTQCLMYITAGPKAAGKNALIGGVVLAMIEGASIAITKVILRCNSHNMSHSRLIISLFYRT